MATNAPAVTPSSTVRGMAGSRTKPVQGTARAFATVAAGLEGGPFLAGRQAPGRGDLACVALLAQVGFRRTMPAIETRLREHTALPGYVVAVYEACGAAAPHWLREEA